MVNGARWTTRAAVLLGLVLFGCISPDEPGALVPPTAEQDPDLPQIEIEVAGHRRAIHVETFGESGAPVILVLHGSLGDYRALRPLNALADRYFMVFWDQRGNGLSERITKDEYTWDSIVEEVEVMRRRYAGERPVTLIGHSFGAMYAALYSSRKPENVAQLVLMEPGGLNGDIFAETYDDIIDIDLFDRGMNEMFWQNELLAPASHARLDYRALMVLWNGRQTNYHCDKEHPPHYPVWRPGGYVEYLRGLRMGATGGATPDFDFDFAHGLDSYKEPVLLLAGSCSALGPDFQRRYHLPLFREAELVTIERAGHRLFVERLPEVLAAMRAYLAAYQAP